MILIDTQWFIANRNYWYLQNLNTFLGGKFVLQKLLRVKEKVHNNKNTDDQILKMSKLCKSKNVQIEM